MAVRRKARSSEARESEQILPEAEMEILAVLHARGEADARAIREALMSFRPMSHASVLTLLGRLEEKGLVARRKAPIGKAFVYNAVRSPKPMYRSLLRRVVSLFDAKVPTREELRQIREIVEELEKRS